MDMGEVRGWIAVITLITFLGICWWAYRSGNRQRFEQDALLPFLDDPDALEAKLVAGDGRGEASLRVEGRETNE